jgi:type II secretory ATPase GspE/PulE/Tfp pilus assembly ATPase PilB-like protein
MGVDPFLIAPTLVLAIAQRLVGTFPEGANVGKPIPVEGSIKMMIDRQFSDLAPEFKKEIPFSDTVYSILPTPDCPKGTRGRTAVFEVFKMDKEIEAAILKSPTELEISALLRKKGMLTMKEDALIKAFQRIIPFEEVNKL